MIEIKHLKKSFGAHHVLKDVNLNIEEGKVTTILGGSGSGKRTLIKCMMRLQNATSGEILLNGRDISKEQNPMRLAACVWRLFGSQICFGYPRRSVYDRRYCLYGDKRLYARIFKVLCIWLFGSHRLLLQRHQHARRSRRSG